MSQNVVIGVDLGGTNMRAAAYYEDGSLASPPFEELSHAQKGTHAVVEAIVGCVHQAISASAVPPKAVGMAVPGFIDSERGVVRWAPNFGETRDGVFHMWLDIPLRSLLASAIPLPIFMGNDANLAALGEYRFGLGRNSAKCLVMLTVGTGIGGGVVMAPQSVFGRAQGPLLLLGGNHGGAELGHMIISAGGLDCTAGTYGALEAYCQRDSIIRRAQYRLLRGRKSIIKDLVEGDLGRVTPKVLKEAADQGDEVAIEVWREVGHSLGVGIANCINFFAPDVVAIGGGIAQAGEWLLEPARQSARNHAVPLLFADATITKAEQIDDAGLLGGAALALEGLRHG